MRSLFAQSQVGTGFSHRNRLPKIRNSSVGMNFFAGKEKCFCGYDHRRNSRSDPSIKHTSEVRLNRHQSLAFAPCTLRKKKRSSFAEPVQYNSFTGCRLPAMMTMTITSSHKTKVSHETQLVAKSEGRFRQSHTAKKKNVYWWSCDHQ